MSSVHDGASGTGWRLWVPNVAHLQVPPDLASRLDAGEVILAAGRASGGGAKARDSAVRDLFGNLDLLYALTGINFSTAIPGHDVLLAQLANAPGEVSRRDDGKEMTHRFVVVDLAASAGLICLLATGTGSRLTEDGEQPFIMRAARTYRRNRACVFACKRLDRGGRHDWGLAPAILAVQSNDGFLCDEDGIGPIDEGRSVVAFVKGTGARKQAKDIPLQTRREQKKRSGTEMVGGQVSYHASAPVPPGFATAWLNGPGTTPEVHLLYLDTAPCRPSESTIAYGQSEVRYPTGHPDAGHVVDQVANVRFILQVYGKPGWSHSKIINELIARRYSTAQFRALHGGNVSITDPRSSSPLVAILDNLDVYETGVLSIGVGAGLDPVVITGCIPPDGPWARPEDFARVRAHRAGAIARAVPRRLTFSGLKVSYDGMPVRMVFYKHGLGLRGALEYRFVLEEHYPRRIITPQPGRHLTAVDFATSLVEALATAGDGPLAYFVPDATMALDAALAQHHADEEQARTLLEARQARLCALRQRIEATDDTGTPILQGALFAEIQRDYNALVDTEIPAAADALHRIELLLEDAEAARPRPTTAERVLHLVESLRDPTDQTYRDLWIPSLHGFGFETGTERQGRNRLKTLTWTGSLLIQGDDELFSIPVTGTSAYPAQRPRTRPAATERAAEKAQAMTDGTPSGITGRRAVRVRHELAAALGISSHHYLLNGCDDPRIVRAATAILQDPSTSDAHLAAELGEPAEFVARIRAVHTDPSADGPWRRSWNRAQAAFYVLTRTTPVVTAAQVAEHSDTSLGQTYNVANDLRRIDPRWSTERKRGYRIAPCDCGGTSSILLAIPEPDGPVCTQCRRDRSGIEWPAEPYDRFQAHPDLDDRR